MENEKTKQPVSAQQIYIHLVDSPKSFVSQEEKDRIFAEARLHTRKMVELTSEELEQIATWLQFGDRHAIVLAFQLGYNRGKAAAMKEVQRDATHN